MRSCPRCRALVADDQGYCLECGVRLPVPRLEAEGSPLASWILRSLVAAVVALGGAAVAIAAVGGNGSEPRLTTATGGFASTPSQSTAPLLEPGRSGVADWPAGEDGWTIVVASLPQTGGRKAAVARARAARTKHLPQVGILDSSRYASLHPGYWIVFAGIYSTEAEATSALEPARKIARTASVQHVVP